MSQLNTEEKELIEFTKISNKIPPVVLKHQLRYYNPVESKVEFFWVEKLNGLSSNTIDFYKPISKT